jgi:hypothetical protein
MIIEVFPDKRKVPFMPCGLILLILVELKVIVLVDGIVGKMHACVLHIASLRLLICFCSESSKPISRDIDSHRVNACDDKVDSEVELEVVDKEWSV